jgi:hypothetical protein
MAHPDYIENRLAQMASDWRRYFGKGEAEIADLVEFNRARMTERAAEAPLGSVRSPWLGRIPINEHSTLNHVQQGTGRRF